MANPAHQVHASGMLQQRKHYSSLWHFTARSGIATSALQCDGNIRKGDRHKADKLEEFCRADCGAEESGVLE